MEYYNYLTNILQFNWVQIFRLLSIASIVMIILFAANCSSKTIQKAPAEEGLKQVTVDGIQIAYLEQGKGDPIVLVHGIPTSSYMWRNMIGPLSAHNKVYALDLPGFGFSDPPPNGDYSIDEYARVFEGFIKKLSIKNLTIICHDWGGPLAAKYVIRNPNNYSKLIILDTFLHNDLPPYPLVLKIAKIRPFGEIFFWMAGRLAVKQGILDGVVNKSTITDDIVDKYYSAHGNPDKIVDSMLGTLRVEYKEDISYIEKSLHLINKPTLIIWGEKDKYLPIYLGERIHKDIPHSKLVKLPNCGHFLPEDNPEETTKIIQDFLKM